ncbi:NfeD family protein [Corynebacterium sp. ES2794-CONJ1]|uniref:NfeD family protein n=1 Tax=unclassified Corynebacterium TaxID=2624378 RepID=UPI002167380A|nr:MULTISPECIES: NfeD family protein [unclassified Corynebacterium]MCS4489317.1 NfeD family protein [Corynebacterium sp. ES2775-CONJ]MCS4491130.1 NfeD family protein [Corynebacterium sp. ES2715-CONJ3]MCS4530989.1 NfeD family protein [Corynebacterium sp. ES2730-CONJ]MCU9518356.1 NfeD family protein [Corynebacterium sp. ES2794-CONJ1]
MGSLIWVIAGLVLLVAELAVGELTLMMLGSAALLTGVVALLGIPVGVEIISFGVFSLMLLIFLKPALKTRFLNQNVYLDTSPKALEGSHALVVEAITAHSGQIKVDGSIWTARSLDPSVTFSEGDTVAVISIESTTAVVWKV